MASLAYALIWPWMEPWLLLTDRATYRLTKAHLFAPHVSHFCSTQNMKMFPCRGSLKFNCNMFFRQDLQFSHNACITEDKQRQTTDTSNQGPGLNVRPQLTKQEI